MASKSSLLASAAICVVSLPSATDAAQAAPKSKHVTARPDAQLVDEVRDHARRRCR
jgi:hypothetical protein